MRGRNVWRYAWPAPLLLAFGPRTFGWRKLVWCRWLPKIETHPVLLFLRAFSFLVQHPLLWWMCRRIDLHYRFGFPMPKVNGYNSLKL